MFSVYFVADPQLAETLVEDGPRPAGLTGVELEDGEPSEIGGLLWALLAGAPLEFDPMRFDTWEDCVGMAHDSCGLILIRDGFVQALAELADERIPAVAATWATADEWQRWDEPWARGELDATVRGLRDLARTARATGQRMYVWSED
jgi:hypothetical protein